MLNSRNLDDLIPKARELAQKFIAACAGEGIEIIITSTYRDAESQAALYAQGRTKPGIIVTNAKAGQSFHNYRCAFDFAPLVNGKIPWADAALFTRCGRIGERIGLEWAGNWKKFHELAHLQWTGGMTLADLQAGKSIPV